MNASASSQRVEFQERARQALSDVSLQRAMAKARGGFVDHRRVAVDALPEFDAIRDAARDIKDHVLANLDGYLELYEQKVIENGGQVHWARDADEACRIVAKICQDAEAKTVTDRWTGVSGSDPPGRCLWFTYRCQVCDGPWTYPRLRARERDLRG